MKPSNKAKIIGITGGIGTGKSTVSNILKDRGYSIIDADIISRDILEKDGIAFKDIVDYFSMSILDDRGNIDRKKLANIVFSDKEKLEKLNDLTHPYIFKTIKKEIDRISKMKDIIFVDIPLLFEEYDKIVDCGINFDEIFLIYLDRYTQIDRIMARNNYTRKEAIDRIDSQMDIEEKKKLATIIIDNTNTKKDLIEELDLVLAVL